MMDIAMFNAVNAIEPRYQPYKFQEQAESWSRSFEQDSAKVKWTAARVGPLQFRARGVTEGGRSPTGDTSCARRKIHAAAARGDGVK